MNLDFPALIGRAFDPLDEWLLERGLLSAERLQALDTLLPESAEPRAVMISRLGLVGEREVANAIAALTGLEPIGANAYPQQAVTDTELSPRFLSTAVMVPLGDDGHTLTLAMADPRDTDALQGVALATGRCVEARLGLPSEIEQAIERCHGSRRSRMDRIADDLGGEPDVEHQQIAHLRDMASEAPVIRLVNLVIERAVAARASDIHIEPFEEGLKIRLRIDGMLVDQESPPARSTAAVISRVKIMARLDIAERRLPQDGRIRLRVQGHDLDLRVSTVPTLHGESVVMRLLDKGGVVFDFAPLGLGDALRERLLALLAQPHGILLVSGPTGSGKTTTLYAALSRLNTTQRKILTVEDPVEYQLAGINQIQVKPGIGLTFASALRAIVRQDPDIIMVGEMRDLETSRIAVQSALTGHLVLSTVHTNNAAASITRLLDMGLEDYLITSTLNGILAQRLVRRLCPLCRTEMRADDATARAEPRLAGQRIFRAQGCSACHHSGYQGRIAIAELLVMSESLRQRVLAHAEAADIQRLAVSEGMRTLYQDGIDKVLAGDTSLEEVLRVTQDN
ncbi:type II secretion system ATPase GspE [Halomonas urumqiensis]|uniref:Type II secretion system protein E n=1 Tax=Halomonas urumqiensis TaxID=1684789 RepID=A0A2N7UP94_9GAMM|nr:type II secretion system ATPase GspE [Halomonas urumqiensis]PMR82250.1 type II secretion system protein GspE [Halomonas urumqiensis]PTB02972.1 type II secretion system protein GspE [Halomonas urumqiensis]GHE20911.1 type II secretion system protein E [Halomonas urumqiensis]